MNTLTPRLTALDESVLAALHPDVGMRPARIAKQVYRPGRSRSPTTSDELAELHGILRGLEHLGLASCSHGWWRRS